MKKSSLKRLGLNLAILAVLVLPELANAQFFNYNKYGDVLAGFRKTGVNEGSYELVVDLGSVTNFLRLSSGTTINITNYSTTQLTNAFMDTGSFADLQWSAFAAFPGSLTPWTTPLGKFPVDTLWLTLPATSLSTQSTSPNRDYAAPQSGQQTLMIGVGNGAYSISSTLGVTNVNNNTVLVREPVSFYQYYLTAYIGDVVDATVGDFGANYSPLNYSVENLTPAPFTSAQRDDFYQLCPRGSTDPITGLTNTTAYFVGYFILNPNGTMTFTRASTNSVTPPPTVISVMGAVTNGFAPLKVVFTNTATGTITNWVWNFGDGTIITNTTGGNVTNTYTAGGNYTVTLAVFGPGGASTNIMASYIIASPTPKLAGPALSGGKLVFSGANCPAGVPYRILTSTNLTSWTPIVTNTFLSNGTFAWTNSTAQAAGYFRLVSP